MRVNRSPKRWSGLRALLPDATCHSSPADVNVSPESSISHWIWVIDRRTFIIADPKPTHLCKKPGWFPLQNLSQTPPFLTISLPKLKPPSPLCHTCKLSSPISLFLLALPATPTSPHPLKPTKLFSNLAAMPCLEHSMPLLQLATPTHTSDLYSNVTFPGFSLTPPNLKEIPDPPVSPWITITLSKYLLICVFVCVSVSFTARL